MRRSRRARHTRYRQPRFDNRRNRKPGWLPPSFKSRVSNIETWVKRLMHLCPISAISQELVKFDLQQMENPEIEWHRVSTWHFSRIRATSYLLQKWNRQCSYCGSKDVPLEVEHIRARANGGTDRASNLTLACTPCNIKKGTQDIGVFLAGSPDLLAKILAQAKASLKDTAAVNATRWKLYERPQGTGLAS